MRVGVWRIVWGEDKTRFFPDYSPVRFEQKGVVAQMVERPLCMRKVGGSMPSYSKSYFCLFFSNWFPFETRVAFPEASDDAGLRPLSRKITRFPVFSLLFWPLVSSLDQSGTVVPIVRSNLANPWRYASPASNKRPSRKAATVAGGPTPCPPGTPRSTVHPKQLAPARLRAHRPKRRTPVNVTGKAHRI